MATNAERHRSAFEPRLSHLPDGRASVHGTAVARSGRAVLIVGGAGAGKSGIAAEMIALGAVLVSDDLVLLRRHGAQIIAEAPASGRGLLELRGIGLTRVPSVAGTELAAVLSLEPSTARLPEPETVTLLGCELPLIRHPAIRGVAAKMLLWLAGP